MTDLNITIAITRNGRGDIWKFSSIEEATRHPLIQYGDAVMGTPQAIMRNYPKHWANDLLEKLEDEDLRISVMQDISNSRDHSEAEKTYMRHIDRIWRRLCAVAKDVPTDPRDVLNQIVYDRDHYNDGIKETTMNTTTAPENKAKKAPAEPKAPKYAPSAKIVMLADKEGKAYGVDNNPKRSGSKAHDRFSKYGNGVTVEAFLKAGGTTADIDNDVAKGFVKVA